ncbi:hypothetical protein [Dehalobacter sp. TeCB1]|uniref:hypothetical protein n=1 Tax=Dehalobacter sp. TeCB1 TaxID=1843715 RepID=UPI00083A7913|nr:hypothetical protein [Dehalobacter sp. TeCB1]OCZ49829.1 hypothetical protein A7D23_00320 [Dehalobacter sp. TeCB1]
MTENFDRMQTERLLNVLDSEIEKKCLELKEKSNNALLMRLFFLGCIATAGIFALHAFIGLPFMKMLVYIVIFQCLSLVLLIPMVMNMNGGQHDIQKIG